MFEFYYGNVRARKETDSIISSLWHPSVQIGSCARGVVSIRAHHDITSWIAKGIQVIDEGRHKKARRALAFCSNMQIWLAGVSTCWSKKRFCSQFHPSLHESPPASHTASRSIYSLVFQSGNYAWRGVNVYLKTKLDERSATARVYFCSLKECK